MNQNNTSLMESENFILPASLEGKGEFTAAELAEDMEGLSMNFQRVKIPGGGTVQFELPSDDPENPDYAKSLVGIVLYNHSACAYWAEGDEYDENAVPLCSSIDGKQGIGTPGGVCASCALNRYGTAPNGRSGKACKNMRIIYLLRSGECMPLQLNLPPTSLKPWRDFLNQSFLLRQRATYGSIIQIGLKKMNNGNDYSVATFRRLHDFTGEDLALVRDFANSFKEQIKRMLKQSASINEEQHDDGYDYITDEAQPAGATGHFNVSNDIDGEREALPA